MRLWRKSTRWRNAHVWQPTCTRIPGNEAHYELNAALYIISECKARPKAARFCNMQQRNTLQATRIPTGKTKSGVCVCATTPCIWMEGSWDAANVTSVRPHQMRKIIIYTPRDQTLLISSAADAILVEMEAAYIVLAAIRANVLRQSWLLINAACMWWIHQCRVNLIRAECVLITFTHCTHLESDVISGAPDVAVLIKVLKSPYYSNCARVFICKYLFIISIY